MSTLYIHEGCIELIGFNELSDRAFFTFRNGGLTISEMKSDSILEQEEYLVDNQKILSPELAERLTNAGFLNPHTFVKGNDGVYYCEYQRN